MCSYDGDVIFMQGEPDVSASPSGDTSELTSSLRLLLHMKENQLSYLIGILIAYQVGILDTLWTYGSGVCV